ncbi:MAG TPA: hypothetical protein VEK32_05875, partial [Thermodesulfobacteriota bacterium]|nr:hypothetical protein [Thermodesulfobacteriota bacterium]
MPELVIPANAGIQKNTGFRIKSGMTNPIKTYIVVYNYLPLSTLYIPFSGKFENALSESGDRIPRFKYSYPTTPTMAALSVQKEG